VELKPNYYVINDTKDPHIAELQQLQLPNGKEYWTVVYNVVGSHGNNYIQRNLINETELASLKI